MEPSKAVKEYKDQIAELQIRVDRYAKVVGKITVERDWAVRKLQSLDLFALMQQNNPSQLEKEKRSKIIPLNFL